VIKLAAAVSGFAERDEEIAQLIFWICLEAPIAVLASPLFHELREMFARLIVRGWTLYFLAGARYNLATAQLWNGRGATCTNK